MKRRIFTALLAALMIAGSALTVGAKTYDDVKDDSRGAAEISMLSDIGVIKGTGESEFSPDEKVSREQMASLLFRLMLGRDDAGRENTTRFEDLYEPYYNGAISWANASGYIRGTSDKTFDPRGGITKQDAMTMLVRALGQENGTMNAGYPWSYINQAVRLGLDRNLEDVRYTDTLTRRECAVILANALTADMLVVRNAQNGASVTEATTIIEEVFGYEMTEAMLEATNNYAMGGDPVVKNGFVAFRTADGRRMVADATGTGVSDSDAHLGETYRLVVKSGSGSDAILSAVPVSERKSYRSLSVDGGKVKIGGESYVLVEKYSDALSTNDNELTLWAAGEDGRYSLVKNTDELKPYLGFYRIEVVDGAAGKTALLMPLALGQLNVNADGRINLADNAEGWTLVNPENAENGDFVLYYRNKTARQIVVTDLCSVVSGSVSRITTGTVRIDGETYSLGNADAGILPDRIADQLTLGKNAVAVIDQNAVVGVIESVAAAKDSRYLTALTDAFRVYADGKFGYVMTAFLDGREQNISVKNADAKAGNVYRYLETDGLYTLIPAEEKNGVLVSGSRAFIQKDGGLDEIALVIRSAKNASLVQVGRNTFALNAGDSELLSSVPALGSVTFIVDDDSIAAVCSDSAWTEKHGAAIGEIRIEDGASVTAVFDNEIGSVETLKYLSVNNGDFGSYSPDASAVRILALNGRVYENDRTLAEYTVYDYATGEIASVLSADADLEIGADYRMGSDGLISARKAEVTSDGFVTGYTSGTISVDGVPYAMGKAMRTVRINKDTKIEDVKVTDLYMKHVEFVAVNGELRLILEKGEASFTGELTEEGIAVKPDFSLSDFADARITVTGLEKDGEKLSVSGMKASVKGDKILIELEEGTELEPGQYVVTFTVNSRSGSASFTVEAKAEEQPAEPEQPENPENPETPENPENPENPETPDNSEEPAEQNGENTGSND